MVDERTALMVAREERQAINAYLEGAYGEDGKALAEREGLEGIVLTSWRGEKYCDVLTEREYGLMPYGAIRWPDRITVLVKRGIEYYYFRRQLIFEARRVRGRSNPGPIFTALRERFGIEAWSKQANDLWHDKAEVIA
jgi:hypothetical protein